MEAAIHLSRARPDGVGKLDPSRAALLQLLTKPNSVTEANLSAPAGIRDRPRASHGRAVEGGLVAEGGADNTGKRAPHPRAVEPAFRQRLEQYAKLVEQQTQLPPQPPVHRGERVPRRLFRDSLAGAATRGPMEGMEAMAASTAAAPDLGRQCALITTELRQRFEAQAELAPGWQLPSELDLCDIIDMDSGMLYGTEDVGCASEEGEDYESDVSVDCDFVEWERFASLDVLDKGSADDAASAIDPATEVQPVNVSGHEMLAAACDSGDAQASPMNPAKVQRLRSQLERKTEIVCTAKAEATKCRRKLQALQKQELQLKAEAKELRTRLQLQHFGAMELANTQQQLAKIEIAFSAQAKERSRYERRLQQLMGDLSNARSQRLEAASRIAQQLGLRTTTQSSLGAGDGASTAAHGRPKSVMRGAATSAAAATSSGAPRRRVGPRSEPKAVTPGTPPRTPPRAVASATLDRCKSQPNLRLRDGAGSKTKDPLKDTPLIASGRPLAERHAGGFARTPT